MKIEEFRRPPEYTEPVRVEPKPDAGCMQTRRKVIEDHERIKTYRFPGKELNAVLVAYQNQNQVSFYAVFAVGMALFELWYASGRWDGRHLNPVKLTNAYVQKRFGLSREQKRRALELLEQAGVVRVDYRGRGQNPWVTLNWVPLAEESVFATAQVVSTPRRHF